MVDLHGKVALITGSSSGVGEAIARGVAARGANVVVNSTSSVTAGERVVRAAVPHLPTTGDGVIVNITSLAGMALR